MKHIDIENDETFLARWLANELTVDELEQFKKTPEYPEYVGIVESTSKFKVEPYEETDAYEEFQQRLKTENTIDHNDNFLGRWVNGNVKEEELKTFKSSKDFKTYQSIIEGISKLKIEKYPYELAYKEFKSEVENNTEKKPKVLKLKIIKYSLIAASLLLFLTLSFFTTNVNIETGFAENQQIILPDNSKVTLNAKSTLTYNRMLYKINRELELRGEAFFEVNKGDKFKVKTNDYTVQVLGTKFNLTNRGDYFKTTCYEGKVQVIKAESNDILSEGEEVSFIGSKKSKKVKQEKLRSPSWLKGVSSFKSAPLSHVLKEIEIQYGVIFENTSLKNKQLLYTGEFPHNKLEEALENVLLPMGINYKVDNKKIILNY